MKLLYKDPESSDPLKSFLPTLNAAYLSIFSSSGWTLVFL